MGQEGLGGLEKRGKVDLKLKKQTSKKAKFLGGGRAKLLEADSMQTLDHANGVSRGDQTNDTLSA